MLSDVLQEAARRHEVPGAAAAVQFRGELTEAATGVLNLDTGVPATPDSLFQIGSVTKPWTALLVTQLADEGLIDLDEPVRAYLPSFAVADEQASRTITVRHLLTHTAGFHGDHFDDTGRGDDAVERYVTLLAEKGTRIAAPGALYSYNNAGFVVLGALVARLRGGTWEDAVRERIGVRAALFAEEALLSRVSAGHIRGAVSPRWQMPRSGGPAGAVICTAPREVVRFGELVPEAMTAAQVSVPGVPGRKAVRYGLGIALYDWAGTRVFGHDGDTIGQAATWRVLPDHDLSLAVCATGGRVSAFFDEVIAAVARETAGLVVPPRPGPPAEPTGVDPAPYAGRYEYPLYTYDVVVAGSGLGLTATPRGFNAAALGSEPETIRFTHLAGDTFVTAEPHDGSYGTMTFVDGFLHDGRAVPKVT